MIDLDLPLNKTNIKRILECDYIDRNRYLSGIIRILDSLEESKIIALDGDWGSGKTWFVKSLQYLLNEEIDFNLTNIDITTLQNVKNEYMTFYYNAWENDDAPSAMLSLIYKLVNDSCLQKEKDQKGILPRLLNTIIKYATNGSVDIQNDLFGEQWTNKQITDVIKTSEEIKACFKEIINNLLIENKNKILIIIDEIDRCKPIFAIDLLENIKHFYDDDKIIFLVATNNKQLSASVCKVYGEKYDGDAYLDKFFDLNLELPNNYIEKYIMAIDENRSSSLYREQSYRELAIFYNLTMREYNRYLKSIKMIQTYIGSIGVIGYISLFINYIIIPLLLILKIKRKNDYYKLITGETFEILESLIRNDEYFYKLGKKILNNKDENAIKKIDEMQITEKEKEEKKEEEVITLIKEMYYDLFINNKNKNLKWEYRDNLNELLDIISMMK